MPGRDDTGRISTELHRRVALREVAADGDQLDDFMESLARKLASKVGSGDGTGGRKFLGMHTSEWVKLLAAWVVAMVISAAAWYMSVRDGLRERPTSAEVRRDVDAGIAAHEKVGEHPKLEARVDAMEATVQDIRESLIRQEALDKSQNEILQDIRSTVRRTR